jgi:hypothetical protein
MSSIWIMDRPEGRFYARRTTSKPKHLKWELQIPNVTPKTRWTSLREIIHNYPGDWRRAGGSDRKGPRVGKREGTSEPVSEA